MLFAALAVMVTAESLSAANLTARSQIRREMPLNIGGSFVLENGAGNIELIGHDQPTMIVVATDVTSAVDQASLEEGKSATRVAFQGDERTRILRTVVPAVRTGTWTTTVHYSIRVPRTVHVKIVSGAAEKVRVSNIVGNVYVKSFNGTMTLDRIGGTTIAESVNGSIIFDPASAPEANVQLSTINGNIVVAVAPDASFDWNGETIRGDFRTTMYGVRARFMDRNTLRAGVNAPGGPTIVTASMMGTAYLLRKGTRPDQAQSMRTGETVQPAPRPNMPSYRFEVVRGPYTYATTLGNIAIREVRGNARLSTGAGEVQVGSVFGTVHVQSMGGPLRLGDVLGIVDARTEAGDVLVNAAREGGTLTTGGGIIRLLYTGGPTSLISGGGDIMVRQAAGAIDAQTESGDISITVQPTAKTEKVGARTAKGNIVLNVSPRFGADVDATVLTSDPHANTITSEIPGLSISRAQVGNKTRIRAVGKINGGGEKVVLNAVDGGIQITKRAGNPITV
ncbi:MAG TPA: hypothetical protein VE010_10145, partial [Thermoanaerobaculia bacterium]|nr:hypothetical protein [Thermoanaerobaculia bacterium]